MTIPLLVLVLAAFGALSTVALAQVGYLGLFMPALQSIAGLQLFADLAIALALAIVWMVANARHSGRNPWPWVVATLLLGSFGPLGYLLAGALRGRRSPLPAGAR